MARPHQSGLHDPYWYEATFAERFIVQMLNVDSGIQSVTIQAPGVHGIDDVMVKYRAKPDAYYQIKHTRVGDTLSFADLTSVRGADSLLGNLAKGWAGVTRNGGTCETHLGTNREMAAASTRDRSAGEDDALPSLEAFWTWLADAIASVESLRDVNVPVEWKAAWETWLAALHELTGPEKLAFLRSLHLDAGQAGLSEIENEVRSSLAALFGVSAETADRALAQLDHHLRVWATSERGADVEVTPERALRALLISEAETVGDHAFAPPSPFFPSRESFVDDLTAMLRQSDAAVFFLTGPAGCGKSSVVSALANRAEPVVDLRFHAFRPLTPYAASIPEDAGRAVTAAALWGDLLVQLRSYFFAGRLWKHQVPVRNDFLLNDPALLRENVLRLAVVLSQERGRPTIIAIDGLDHAARARHLTPEALAGRVSLLASLIPPDEVPPGIVFLIAGQPGWEGYPSWLRTPRADVHVTNVPPIDVDDIATLLRVSPRTFPADQVDAAARVIADLTAGNTLPVVYAVAEAQTVSDVEELQARFAARRLGGSLEDYYSAIWSAAVATNGPPATTVQLATALALSTARLTPELLTGFFPESSLSSADWRVILGKLSPIVDATADTFAIRHNDLRVFLMAQLQGDGPSLMAAASAMASFYQTAPPSDAKHADLLRLLDLASRESEIPSVMSPPYVAEATALHRPVSELVEQGALALASVTEDTGWKGVHTLALGLATVQQARSLVQYYSLEQAPRAIPPCLVSEARVIPRSEWSLQVVERLFADAKTLLAAGERDRAQALVRRWLCDITPVSLAALLKAQPGDLQPWEVRDIDERIKHVVRVAGELAQSVGVNRATLQEPITDVSRPVLATFYGGWLAAGVRSTVRPWVRTLQMPPTWYTSDVEKCIEELAGDERWSDVVASLEVRGTDRERMSNSFRVRAAEWVIRAQAAEAVLLTWATPIAKGGFAALPVDEGYQSDSLDLYVAVAFVVAYMEPARHSGGISDDGATAYFRRYNDMRREEHVRRLLYAAAWTGKTLRRVHTRAPTEPLLVPASELAAVVKSLLCPAWDKPAFVPPEFLSQGPRLVALILQLLSPADVDLEPELSNVLISFATERRASSALEVVWPALAKRGRRDILEAWMQEWIGDDGRVWGLELGERFDIVRRFSVLAREAGWEAEAKRAENRLRWNQLGYTGHKDYSLIGPLDWFRDVARDDPATWETFGARLLSISDEASRTGDNRMAVHVDGAVATAAAQCGPGSLWRLAVASATAHKEPFVFGETFIFDGIIGALETATISADDLRAIWSAGIGGLVWEHERGRMEMSHIREALVAAANRTGHASVPAELQQMAGFEYAMGGSNGGYKHPTRWFRSNAEEDGRRPVNDLEREIASLDIEDAVRRLSHCATSPPHHLSDLWRAVEACGKRLQSEHPSSHAESVQALVEILRLRTEHYTWSFDAFGDAVASIVPLLPEADQWEFCRSQILQIDTTDSPDVWLVAASENIRSMARLHALTTCVQDRVAGLDDELRMHETWILGPADENRRAWPSVGVAATTTADPSTWAAFVFHGLVDLLRSLGSARCRAAIKGLYALLADNGAANGLGAREWPRLVESQRERLLVLLERLAAERSDHFVAWQGAVEEVLATGDGADQIQAWVTLHAFARAIGEPPERWPLPTAAEHDHGKIIRTADPLLDLPRDTLGTVGLTYGLSGVRQLAQMFARAIDEDEDLIEAMVSDHLKTVPPLPESNSAVEPREDLLDGEMKMFRGDGVRETIRFLVEEARAGCFGDVTPTEIAQALLTNDEPRLLTTSGTPIDKHVVWPTDQDLEAVVASGEAAVVEALITVARGGTARGESVLAAELETYSRYHDVALHVATGWARDPLARDASRRPSTFNGRAHLLYGGGGYEPLQSRTTGWLTFRAGGLGMFVHSSLSLVPAAIWETFGWKPTPTNPLVWVQGDNIVARCELLRGPVRDVIQDYLHRQPILLRWVVSNEALQLAEQQLRVSFRQIADPEVKRIRTA